MNKFIKIILVSVLLILLFLVRAYSEELFYDPLINYFKNDYLYTKIPPIKRWHLIVDMLFRYVINSLISLGVIWVLFQRKDYLKFSGFFLMLAFMILIIAFVLLLRNDLENEYLLAFYIRRFLIQPIFLLLLLPAFYYQKLSNR